MDLDSWIKRFFKRLYYKFRISIRKSSIGDIKEEKEYQKTCLAICRKLITQKDTQFLLAPISGKRYITNKRMQIFIVLQDRHVNIINHVYNYSVFVGLRDWEKLMFTYDNESERRRLEYENQIKSQIDHSLHKILESLILQEPKSNSVQNVINN